tara:strand:+ start:98 stop:262 length:165 start_codon:yes stop_codon:yes gene_type:complete
MAKRRWVDAAPPKATKRGAVETLHHVIPQEEWDQHRVIKRGTRWIIQWSPEKEN